jgi:hypothetical protein
MVTPTGSLANPGQAVAARAKRGKRGVLFAAPGLWLLPSQGSGHVAPDQLWAMPTFSVHTGPHQPAFALGSPVGVGYWRLGGGGEVLVRSPREAMNLVHVRRIRRRRRRRRKVYSRLTQ